MGTSHWHLRVRRTLARLADEGALLVGVARQSGSVLTLQVAQSFSLAPSCASMRASRPGYSFSASLGLPPSACGMKWLGKRCTQTAAAPGQGSWNFGTNAARDTRDTVSYADLASRDMTTARLSNSGARSTLACTGTWLGQTCPHTGCLASTWETSRRKVPPGPMPLTSPCGLASAVKRDTARASSTCSGTSALASRLCVVVLKQEFVMLHRDSRQACHAWRCATPPRRLKARLWGRGLACRDA